MGISRKATARWEGDLKSGRGTISTPASGLMQDTRYGFNSRFGDGKGTNPEELIAAAHAGCFSMALAFGLQRAGFTPDELRTEAAISLDQDGGGFKITRSALTLRARVPGISENQFRQLAEEAEKTCPVSKVLNAEITLDAQLEA